VTAHTGNIQTGSLRNKAAKVPRMGYQRISQKKKPKLKKKRRMPRSLARKQNLMTIKLLLKKKKSKLYFQK